MEVAYSVATTTRTRVDTAPAGSRPTPPLTAPGAGRLASVRAAFAHAGYTAEAVAEARRRHRFLTPGEELAADVHFAALVRLLALGQPVALVEASGAVAPAAVPDLHQIGLVTLTSERVVPDYCLLPHEHLLLAGDRAGVAERDLVDAFTEPSLALARLTPRTPTRSMLDLGTGSGILALLGAPHCDQVTAVDVNPRALTFARFNADLNEVRNIELLEGSWFEPVAGRRFDLIVGNPPYVISPDHEFTYRDSGLPPGGLMGIICRDGAAHLETDGLAIFLCSWPHQSDDDWAAAPTAAVEGTGCDALVLCRETLDSLDHAVSWNTPPVRYLDPDSLRETVGRWHRYYRAIGAAKISLGAVVLRRRDSGNPWLTALKAPKAFGERAAEQLVRLLRGQDQSKSVDDSALLATRFSLPAGIDVTQRFQRRASGFVARPAMVTFEDGLGVRAAIDPDALEVLFACDGTRTLGEIVDGLAARRGLEAGPLSELTVGAARELLGHGLLAG